MGTLELQLTASLALSLCVGVAAATVMRPPASIGQHADRGEISNAVRYGDADITGSIAQSSASAAAGENSAHLPTINRTLKGDRLIANDLPPAEPSPAPKISSPNEAPPPRAGNRTVSGTQGAIASPPADAAPQAAPKTRLALAHVTDPAAETSDRSLTKRQSVAERGPPIVIGHSRDDHDGGDVDVFAAKYDKIRKSGRKVVIDGLCFSACTIVASLPKDQVCVTPKAALGVHLATSDDGPAERVDLEYSNRAVKKYYPQALQDWIKKHGGLQEQPKYVKGNDLLTIFDACKNGA